MWIMQSNSFVSIVEHHASSDALLIRGRFAGDVERFMGWRPGDSRVREGEGTDYRFRATASRDQVAAAVARAVAGVRYPNFKASIVQKWRSSLAMQVWNLFFDAQEDQRGGAR